LHELTLLPEYPPAEREKARVYGFSPIKSKATSLKLHKNNHLDLFFNWFFMLRLILASSSPYRRQLLERLRLPFQTISPDVVETSQAGETPGALATRLAREKALAVAQWHPQALIIGSDQVADLDGRALGKPGHHAHAARQLAAMSGKHVVFHTAVCLHNAATGAQQLDNVQTRVQMRTLDADEIEAYLHADQPYDCAGSAKVESLGIVLAESIESCDPTALIGLPLITLARMLRTEGVALPRAPTV
jgi:septum formation protein